MDSRVIRVGRRVVSMGYVAAAQWSKGKLYVYLSGGRFMEFEREDAAAMWRQLELASVEVGQDGKGSLPPPGVEAETVG